MIHETSIALLIDADNSPANKIEEIIDELAKYGVINIRRAYGNWKSPSLKSGKRFCMTMLSSQFNSLRTPKARTQPIRQ